jgi:hypothetical protein
MLAGPAERGATTPATAEDVIKPAATIAGAAHTSGRP